MLPAAAAPPVAAADPVGATVEQADRRPVVAMTPAPSPIEVSRLRRETPFFLTSEMIFVSDTFLPFAVLIEFPLVIFDGSGVPVKIRRVPAWSRVGPSEL